MPRAVSQGPEKVPPGWLQRPAESSQPPHMQSTRLLRSLARGVSWAGVGDTAQVVRIVARATARSQNPKKQDKEKRVLGQGAFCAASPLLPVPVLSVMAFHSSRYCADGWGGFGD